MNRPTLSIRLALLLALGGLVALIAAQSWFWAHNQATRLPEVAARLVDLTHLRAQMHVESLVSPIRKELAEAHRNLRAGRLPRYDTPALLATLLPGLYEMPEVGSMMVGDPSGYQLLVMRYDERVTSSPLLAGQDDLPPVQQGQVLYCTREFRLAEWGQSSLWTLWSEDGASALAQWRIDLEGYDPRERPWLKAALARLKACEARGAEAQFEELLAWTDPYVLYTSKTLGLSAALAARGPDGEVVVVAYDLLLEDMNTFLQGQKPGPGGMAIVLTEDGRAVALASAAAASETHLLRPLDEIEAAGVPGASSALLSAAASEPIRMYESVGRRWFGNLRALPLGGDAQLLVGVALPREDVQALVGHSPEQIIGVTLLSLLAAILLALLVSGRITSRLAAVVQESGRIGRLDLAPRPRVLSRLRELDELGASLDAARGALREHIAARDEARDALLASEASFRATFEQAAAGMLHVSPDGSVLRVNQRFCQLLGYTQAELVGHHFASFTHPEHREADLERVQRLLAGERETDGWEKRYIRKDGSARWARITTRLLRDEAGKPRYFLTVVLDVHEQKELEQSLLQAQRLEAVGRLAGGVAHDFNNILTVLAGQAREASRKLALGAPAQAELDQMTRAIESAAALVKQLLTFAQRDNAEPVPLDLHEELRATEAMLRRLVREDIELLVLAEPGQHRVLIARTQLQQVLLNLAVNASDAMPHGGCLTIELRRSRRPAGADIELVFADTGLGMSAETRAHAFDPFFSTKDSGRGTGLGLATCHGIVQRARGTIELESEPNRGTRVRVRLPETDQPVPPAPLPAKAGPSHAGKTLLLVEDEAPIRKLIEQVLRQQGFRLHSAASGEEALAIARELAQIDLLVTDMIMPGMNGGELAANLRKAQSRAARLVRFRLSAGSPGREDPSRYAPPHEALYAGSAGAGHPRGPGRAARRGRARLHARVLAQCNGRFCVVCCPGSPPGGVAPPRRIALDTRSSSRLAMRRTSTTDHAEPSVTLH